MKTIRTVLILLATGGALFSACQSNNKPVAQRADTANAAAVNNFTASQVPVAATDNGNNLNRLDTSATPAAAGVAASSEATWTGDKKSQGAAGSTSDMICVPRRRTQSHKLAYNRHYTHRHYTHKKTKSSCSTETSVATVEPIKEEPAPEASTTVVTPSATTDITYEKPAEFTGNVPAAKKRAKVHLGIEAGGNLNNLYHRSEDNTGSNELKVGFHGGVMMNVELGKHFAFEPGVRYIMKGGELTSTSTDGVFTTEHKEKLTFHYIEMPLNIVYNSGEWGTNSFMIGAGPYFSYLANAEDKVKDKVSGPDGTVINTGQHKLPVGDPDNVGTVRYYDAGAGAFIGYQMRSGVYVKGGAEFGLLDLQKNVNTLGDFNNRNYNFLLTVGYKCGYKK
jgi:hypothetical protein